MFNLPYTFSNGITVKNQWVMAPLSLPFSSLGHLTQEDVEFILERSKPFGMIVVGAHAITEQAKAFDSAWFVGENLQLPQTQRLIETCHEQDIKIILQVCDGSNKTRPQRVNEMSLQEILQVITRFAEVTTLAIEAGFDGIELHAANSYLLQAFLSPMTNQRQDAYGGDLKARSLLLQQLIKTVDGIRLAMNQQFLVGMRYIPEEIGQGFKLEDSLEWIESRLIPTDLLNYVHLSLRDWNQQSESGQAILESIRAAIPPEVTLITSGMVYDEEVANRVLVHADMVSVGSALMSVDLPLNEMPARLESFDKMERTCQKLELFNLPKNPVLFGPMTTESSYENGALSREEIDFYVKRAALVDGIVLGATGINSTAMRLPRGNYLYNRQQLFAYKGLNQRIHQNKAISIVQLYHAGLASGLDDTSIQQLDESLKFDGYDVESSEPLQKILADFIKSIDLAAQANFDGIELSFAPPSIWMDILCKNLTNKQGAFFIEKTLNVFKTRLKQEGLKTLGIRLTPEFLMQNKVLLGQFRDLLVQLESIIDYVSLNVTDIHQLNSQVAIEQCLKATKQLPVLISGKIRDEQDCRNAYYKGWIPMMVRPIIFKNVPTQAQKDWMIRELPQGLKESIEQSGDWYFE